MNPDPYTRDQMDAARADAEPRVESFDELHAEAKAAVTYGANVLRGVRERYREAFAAEQARWQRLREELDALERRILDAHRPRPLRTVDTPVAVPLEPDRDGEAVPLDVRAAAIRAALESLSVVLAEHQTELGRLEVAIRNVESTWLFLERGDATLVAETTAPGNVADLQMRIVEAQESERSRLAQDVHDGPAQALSNAIFQVEFIERVVGRDPRLAAAELRFLGDLLRRELGEVRSFISQLRPPVLAEAGLVGAIRDAADDLEALAGIAVDVDIATPGRPLSETEQTVALRVTQEALQNVRKHAAAAHVSVTAVSDGAQWILAIHDDGRGFDIASTVGRARRHFGLQFMRERAELIGARLDVRSGSDGGTVVRLAIPTGEEESR